MFRAAQGSGRDGIYAKASEAKPDDPIPHGRRRLDSLFSIESIFLVTLTPDS